MSGAATVASRDQILAEIVERDHRLELHYQTTGGELVVGHTRIVGIEDKCLAIGQPRSVLGQVHYSVGQVLDAYLTLAGQMYRFTSKVVEIDRPVRLNAQKRITGMLIRLPDKLEASQRRHTFRVSLGAVKPIAVRMHETEAGDIPFSPLDGVVADGVLLNLAEGGMACRVNDLNYQRYRVGMHMSIAFTLPDHAEPLHLLAQIRSARPMLNGRATRLGLFFVPLPDPRRHRQAIAPLSQFIMTLQREQLARQRQKA